MRKVPRVLLILCFIIALLCFGVNAWLSWSARGKIYQSNATVPYNTYALLLGTAKYGEHGEEYELYTQRINTAVALYKSGKVKYLLASSTNNSKYSFNAQTMKADLIALGVREADVFVDPLGIRTLHSIIRCKEKYGIGSVTLISQERHCERALYIAAHKGLNAIAFAAPAGSKEYDIGTVFHEQVARFVMIYDLLRGNGI